jgi:hypothetical protein
MVHVAVPVTTLQRPKREGGWDLPHVETKCKALLYNRIQMTGAKRGTVMSEFLRRWTLNGVISKPPVAQGLPATLIYLQQ